MTSRNRLTRISKSAKKYENADVLSMNNAFEDPDHDKYSIETSDHFGELPDMRSEWKKDIGAYDEETNFLWPLDDVPSWWGQGPKMASMKAEACLKIAEAMFPDAVDEFVDQQAADLMELPDRVVLATIKRMAMYEEEPLRVDALLGKRASEEGEVEYEEEQEPSAPASTQEDSEAAPESDSLVDDIAKALEGAEGATSNNEMSSGEMGDDQLAMSEDEEEVNGMMDMDLEATKASINPSTEFGSFFEYDGDVEDVSFGNTVTASLDDIESVFSDDYSGSTHLRKSASVKSSKASNLKLSEYMGNAVPKKQQSLVSLWDSSPNVEASFK